MLPVAACCNTGAEGTQGRAGEEHSRALLGQSWRMPGFLSIRTSRVCTCPKSCLYPTTTSVNLTRGSTLSSQWGCYSTDTVTGNEGSVLTTRLAVSFGPRHLMLPQHQRPSRTGKCIFRLQTLFKSAPKLILRWESIRIWQRQEELQQQLTLGKEWLLRKRGQYRRHFSVCCWSVLRYTDRQHRGTQTDKNRPTRTQANTSVVLSAIWHVHSCLQPQWRQVADTR